MKFKAILRQAKSGNEDAIGQMIDMYRPMINKYSFAYSSA